MFKSLVASGRKLTSGSSQTSDGSAPPASMQWAVKLMQAGAAASTVYLIFSVAIASTVKSSLTKWNATQPKAKQLTSAQISTAATDLIVSIIIVGLISIALWLWMARKNNEGKTWARITSTVLFLLWSYYTYNSIASTRGAATLIASTVIVLVIWVIGLGALFMLWRQESSAYFKEKNS
jgi:hypothetical protein